jgi:RNA-directed DNA polymerase
MRMIFEEKARPLPITGNMVQNAFKKVRANQGGSGIDRISLTQFEEKLSENLYKIWNRLSSGSYFPPAVREHEIEKDNGKTRKLGIPTVGDRIAQQVIKDYLEPRLEAVFHDNSYGYRPFRSAHQALARVSSNVRKYAWVIDLDITAFFDNVAHEKWVKMYIQRWLEAPIAKANGELLTRSGIGTPQGGVISPLLANLYLHYTFDKWMEQEFPKLSFVRYADDIIIHCHTESQANYVIERVQSRLNACNLSVHPEKTSIVYCKDYRRIERKDKKTKFDFLGFSFRPMSLKSNRGGMFLGYSCEISKKSYSKIVGVFRDLKFNRWAKSWQDIAELLNDKIRGWIQYYDKYQPRTLTDVFHRFHKRLTKWICNYYKKFNGSMKRAYKHLKYIRHHYPTLFYHWEIGYPIV